MYLRHQHSLLFFQFFSIIVFGCISSKGTDRETDKCLYNENPNACNYGITIGVMAFLGLIVFLLLDAVFETKISSIQHRKYIVMADVAFSGMLTSNRSLIIPRENEGI